MKPARTWSPPKSGLSGSTDPFVQNSPKPLPIKFCRACGGTWFREQTFYEFLPQKVQPASLMPMYLLICLCGTPLRLQLGGVRAGFTPNIELARLFRSMDCAERYQERCRVPARQERAMSKDFVERDRLRELQRVVAGLEGRIGLLLASPERRRSKAGRHWRLPERKPATKSKGRDWLTIEIQKCGLTFEEARDTLAAIIDSMTDRLKTGESVESPLGVFRVKKRAESDLRFRFGKLQHMRQKRVVFKPAAEFQHLYPKRIVFKAATDLLTKGT